MAYIRSGNPRDIIIVYVETIPTLTFTSWYPGQPRNSVVSTSQSEFSEDPASQSDICIDTTNCMPQSSINIDQYIIKDKHRHMEFKQRGTLPSLSDKSDSTSDATEEDYTDSYSDMSASELWELPLNQPQDQQNLPNFDIVIEDYSKLSDFEKSVTDLNHNNMKCIDTLDYGDTKNKWKEDTIPEHVDKSYDVVTNLFEPPLQKTELHVTTTTTTTNNLSAGEKESADSLSPNDLEKLKLIATRLNLQTRRGSYTTWRNKLAQVTSDKNIKADQSSETEYTKEDKPDTSNQSDEEKLRMKPRSIAESLAFIKSELMDIRRQDESLARQFISIRNDIQQLKLQHSTRVYEDMVDDAQWTIAENEEYDSVCDEPRTLVGRSPLITLGITKMNLTERRFSVF